MEVYNKFVFLFVLFFIDLLHYKLLDLWIKFQC